MAAVASARSRRRLSLAEPPFRPSLSYCHRRSPSDSVTTNSTSLVRKLRRYILTNARYHLRDYAIVQYITAERFAPFLPQESDSSDAVALSHRWVTAPLLVSDGELQHMLNFRAADQPELRQSYCYFRSWPMEKWQLERIMQSIQADGYSYSVFSNWSFLIRGMANNIIATSERLLEAHPVSHTSGDRSDSCISSNMLRPVHTGTKNIPDEVEVLFSNCASHMRVFFEGSQIACELHKANFILASASDRSSLYTRRKSQAW
ncbi:hypothetical protein BKA66DRAFT_197696 [Pyrenochaeta sp. MPI-SDFR-AT-0127]|nr:hypothetical protein BKA66DRAFT_197696 [Pyrenochaeta sp. MPI-SDFR-AT-0127]